MQLTLGFLQASPPPKEPNINLRAATRAEAVKDLARMIARAIEVRKQKETTNE